MSQPDGPPFDMAAVIANDIDLDRRLFEETGNPMWAWSAIHSVIEFGLPMPEWLAEYIRDSAAELIGTAGDAGSPYPARVLAALGFRRREGKDDMREYAARMRKMKRGLRVWLRVKAEGRTPKFAAERVEDVEGGQGDATSHLRGWKYLKDLLNL